LITEQSLETVSRPRLISVLSGKGGVGKTVVSFNLAERLAARGLRVLVVDADFACGNLHLLANLAADYGIEQFARRELALKEAVLAVTDNLDLLASVRCGDPWDTADAAAAARLARQLRDQGQGYDAVVMDHASGVSKTATVLGHASDFNVLLVVPELTSLADAAGLYKYLKQADHSLVCGLVVNRAADEREADYVRTKFAAVCERFFGGSPLAAGRVFEDASIRRALGSQQPLATVDPNAIACKQLTEAAGYLVGRLALTTGRVRLSSPTGIKSNQATADIRE
jgi:flagellar biosynthesis protein FlhG